MQKQKGFTIVEVLIVIVVVAILAALVFTVVGGIKGGTSGPRYRVDTPDGSSYWTDSYEEKDGCITFNYWNGQKKTCGSYTVGQY